MRSEGTGVGAGAGAGATGAGAGAGAGARGIGPGNRVIQYDPKLNPSTINLFTAGCFRYLHTLISDENRYVPCKWSPRKLNIHAILEENYRESSAFVKCLSRYIYIFFTEHQILMSEKSTRDKREVHRKVKIGCDVSLKTCT